MTRGILRGWVAALILFLTVSPVIAIDYRITITGGRTGASINTFANAMAVYIPMVNTGIEAVAVGSDGSVDNLKRLSSGEADFGICYSADSDHGYNGKRSDENPGAGSLRAMGYLYGAPAQLVVSAESEITSVQQLKGKRIAVGRVKSEAAVSAQRFFRHMGVWDTLTPLSLGFKKAAAAFKEGRVDAFWVMVGFPNRGVMEATKKTKIRLLDLGPDAEKTGFYNAFAYVPATIPAGTYGQEMPPCLTFQNVVMLNTHQDVSDDLVYTIMKTLWSEEGRIAMAAAKSTFKEMSLTNAFKGASIPLHPGAVKFWMEMGKQIPDQLQPPLMW